jgi:hypothetical protein
MSAKFEIWKDGHLYLTLEDRDEAHRMFEVVRSTFKPRVLKLYEKITTTIVLRDNDYERPLDAPRKITLV